MEPPRPADPGPPLHPLLATRRSLRAFDPRAELSDEEAATLIEAARWAPSSRNMQPWRFLVGRRDTELHKRIFKYVFPHNQRWAGRASALVVGAHLTVSPQGSMLPHAAYDLGQAVAHLSIQAMALGLSTHQMAGFDAHRLCLDLGLPDELRVKVVVAVGRPGDPGELPDDLREREQAPRVRHPLSTLLLADSADSRHTGS